MYRFLSPVIFLLLLSLVTTCVASEPSKNKSVEIDNFTTAVQAAKRLGNKYGPERVLVVFDIDNTLLAMDHDLGSDQWFNWQAELLANSPKSKQLIAQDFPGLLDAQGILFDLTGMHAPQANGAELFGLLQKQSFMTLVLTSRGDDFRPFTERELSKNGFATAKNALPASLPAGKTFLPYKAENLTKSGLTQKEMERFKLKAPRPVSYSNGIYMSAGQHKGAILLTVLAKSKRTVSAVVFIDDHAKHTDRVFEAVSGRGIEVITFRYSKEDANVQRFKKADKQKVTEQWQEILQGLTAILN